jgi:hypothetical protein
MADVATSAPAESTSATVAADSAATSSPSTTETPSVTSTESTGDMVSAAAEIYQRLAAEEPPPSAPSASTPPAQAATAPAPSSETPAEATTRGPIPFDRHKAVITNTRNEASAEARQKTLEEYGIGGLSAEEVRTGVSMLQSLKRGGIGFLDYLRNQIDPQAAAATATASAAAPKPPEDPEPEPDIPLADGRFVYSAEQLRARDQWRERQLLKQVDERYGPIRDAHEQQTLTTRRRAEAGNMVATAERWPLFNDLRPHIRELIKAHQGPLTPTSLHDAYITAYQTHGVRLQRESWERERNGQRVDELNRKAGAATVRPGAPQPLTPRTTKDKSTEEVAREIYHRMAAE